MDEASRTKLLKRKRKAENEGNHKILICTCTDLSALYMKSGLFHQALEEYKTLAGIYRTECNQIEYAKANRGIGEAYLGLHNYKKALEHQKLYLDIATSEKDVLEVQRAYATIGHIYLTNFLEAQADPEVNLNAAYKHFMKSMKLCESLSGITKLEKADMQARLLSNLGLVKESLGDFNKAVELFTASINICKSNDIYEQLYRGYMSMASLFDKKGDSGKCMHHYNLAIDAAKKLKENVDLMCAALLVKSELLIKLGDFHTAKKSLYKAYKCKSPNIQDRKMIEKYLRTVITMCRTEDKLVIETNDTMELKRLYEKMGDCACNLKNFPKALEYYKLMLTNAEKSGIGGRELASCYYSLAETYKDNRMYEDAEKFFEKEYALCVELKDNLNTLSKIADTKEVAGRSVDEVIAVYERAIENCQRDNNLKEERRMITRCIAYLNRVENISEANKYEKRLNSLEKPSLEEESLSGSDTDQSESDDKENEIDLSNITDVSDDSDNDQNPVHESVPLVGKRRSKTFVVKKNAKGESQLHVACINGKLPVVKHLLEQGHPVNVRDNSGWLPIHEACNHGHVEIVKLLLDKGAAINDRGGVKCEGITPIFDASFNGHLKVVELLLERGASVAIKSDNGDTPLNVLKLWHQKNPFRGDDHDLYQKIVDKMTEALEKIGYHVGQEIVVHHRIEDDSEEQQFVEDPPSDKSEDDCSEGGDYSRGPSTDVVNEYQEAMNSIRKKPVKQQEARQSTGKRPALVYEDKMFDDWLEDDIQPAKSTKKRKISLVDAMVTSSTSRNSTPSKRLSDENIRLINEDMADIATTKTPSPAKKIHSYNSQSQNNIKRKLQASLLDAGFQKTSNKNKNASSTLRRHRTFDHAVKQPKITTFGATKSFAESNSTISQPVQVQSQVVKVQETVANIMNGDLMVYVDVNIEEKVFRVPVLLSQVPTNTIGWLADQAAQKYARKECSKPCLELETKTGALLSDEDPLSLLFPLGTTQAETVIGRIIKLYMTPLVDRYKEACSHMKESCNENLTTLLEEVSVKLSLRNRGFTSITLSPLCKALNHQTTLLDLNLSGNFLDINCMTILCASLPSLINLSSLNLKCTGLTSHHLTELVKMFSISETILGKLKHLDISHNYLRNKSLRHLAEITERLRLESVNMSNVALEKMENSAPKLRLTDVRRIDISRNRLSARDVEKFLSWTTVDELVHLNISRNDFSVNGEFLENYSFSSLKSLILSESNLQDNNLYELLRMCSGRCLTEIDLSYNSDLTGISLRRLLDHSTLNKITLLGCDKIFDYFTEYFAENEMESTEKIIKISADFSIYDAQVNSLVDSFRNMYKRPLIEKGRNLLLLSSSEIDS